MQYIFFLGSHPELSATEAWRVLILLGYSPTLVAATEEYLHVALTRELDASIQDRLGGTERIARVVAVQDTPWTAEAVSQHLLSPALSQRKIRLGLSIYSVDEFDLPTFAHEVKEMVRAAGGKLQFILPKGSRVRLNAAQVEFNKLLQPPHRELVLVSDEQYWLTETVNVQDIAAYTRRDTDRPARDPKIGLLPPKLTQIMINCAVSASDLADEQTPYILDPFCGMGTVLQEAWLMDYKSMGADTNERMVRASERNLDWLAKQFTLDKRLRPTLLTHNAQHAFDRHLQGTITAMVTEPFLGKPITRPRPVEELKKQMDELGKLYLRVFATTKHVLRAGGSTLFLLPAFRTAPGADDFHLFPLPFLDALERIGYRRVQLVPEELAHIYEGSDRGTLIYARPDALVGRELTLWEKQ